MDGVSEISFAGGCVRLSGCGLAGSYVGWVWFS